MAGRASLKAIRLRDPVTRSLGEVGGVFHASQPYLRETNSRSSRRGKEQMSSKTSKEVVLRLSDLRAGENPWNGTRDVWRSAARPSKCKCATL
jgi:hypothetical protein